MNKKTPAKASTSKATKAKTPAKAPTSKATKAKKANGSY